jgi:hypothetical protein
MYLQLLVPVYEDASSNKFEYPPLTYDHTDEDMYQYLTLADILVPPTDTASTFQTAPVTVDGAQVQHAWRFNG